MVQIARAKSPLPVPAPETAGAVSSSPRREPQAGATDCRQEGEEKSALIPLGRAGDIDDLDGKGSIAAPRGIAKGKVRNAWRSCTSATSASAREGCAGTSTWNPQHHRPVAAS